MGNEIINEDLKEIISSNLVKYRKAKNMSQADLGVQLGVKKGAVSAWETGKNDIDVKVAYKICSILGITMLQLVEGKEEDTKETGLEPEPYIEILKGRPALQLLIAASADLNDDEIKKTLKIIEMLKE